MDELGFKLADLMLLQGEVLGLLAEILVLFLKLNVLVLDLGYEALFRVLKLF